MRCPNIALTILTMVLGMAACSKEISFSGSFEYRTDQQSLEMLGHKVCFYPTDQTAARAPRTQ
jgi:hypothetical protein